MVNRFMKSYAFCSFFFKVLFSSSSIIFSRFSRSISSNMAVPLSLGSTRRYFSYCCIACSFTKSASVCTSSALSDFLFSKFRPVLQGFVVFIGILCFVLVNLHFLPTLFCLFRFLPDFLYSLLIFL